MAVQIKNEVIRVRATRARKEVWRQMAEEDGRRLSEWLRWLADRRIAERLGEGARVA
jgi:hypothetical protein